MNKLDLQYQGLLRDILDNGISKTDRTGTGTLSVFSRQIRHKMSEGFPLLTTKRMPFKTIATELLWFLRGDTNINFLIDNNCHIWNGDAIKNYEKHNGEIDWGQFVTKEEAFIESMKDPEFAKKWGDLGPVYGKQWRNWDKFQITNYNGVETIDQIENLINDLKTNPDSRRLIVSAWNPADLEASVLPPCHYGFQVYTRELSLEERRTLVTQGMFNQIYNGGEPNTLSHSEIDQWNIPTRAISLMWNQRSVDTFLGLPFNIASYGLLLEIIAKAVNLVPDELIGNLGDVHLYSNHVEQAREQIGRKYTSDERTSLLINSMGLDAYQNAVSELMPFGGGMSEYYDQYKIPYSTREPYQLPTLNINTEFWPHLNDGRIDAVSVFNNFTNNNFCKCLLEEDLQLSSYKSHASIKAPLSN